MTQPHAPAAGVRKPAQRQPRTKVRFGAALMAGIED